MADDSVTVKSPSLRKGRLGKAAPMVSFLVLTHSSLEAGLYSFSSIPRYLATSLLVSPNPLKPQYPNSMINLQFWKISKIYLILRIECSRLQAKGFGVWGLGFGVWGLGFG